MKENTIIINYCKSEKEQNEENISMSFNKSNEVQEANNRSFLSLQNLNVKKRKSIVIQRRSKKHSITLPRKDFILDNMYNEENEVVIEVKKKLQNSILYTGRKLKEKIEKNLSTQLGNTTLKNSGFLSYMDNLDDTKKSEETNKSFNSLVKKNILKSLKTKNLKKRRRYSNIKDRNRRLFQVKHVYDSLEDSEDIISSNEDTFYISPETNFIYIFDLLIIFCLCVCIIYIPLTISFHSSNSNDFNIFEKILFYFIDLIFLIDLFIGFFKGYYNNELKLITEKKSIIKKYLSTYFLYDLIAALPCCSFLVHYYSEIFFLYNENNNQYIFILFLSFLKLVKCSKIKNNKFVENMYEYFSKNYLTEKIFEINKIILLTFSILHILVCGHIFIGYHFYPSWLVVLRSKSSINSPFSIYIASLYCLITTLTTVGYGDIVCISFAERIFQIVELSLGIIIYSYIISKLGDYVEIESYATMIYNNRSAILEDIRRNHPNLSFKLYNQLLHHLQTNFQQRKKSDINLLINSLPHALKYTLLFVINKNYINHFHFFKKCYNSNFIAYTLVNFVPTTYRKNALIIKEDELIDNAIFVSDGRLSLEIAIDLDNPEESVKKYCNKKYNRLKKEEGNKASALNGCTTMELLESRKTLNEFRSFVTKNTEIIDEKLFNYSKIERGFDESNYQFLNVTNIFKNEHYGEVFIILNKPSPLYVRVKSKKVNLFLLNKKHILHLSSNFINIWKRLFQKSLKNMKALRQKTSQLAKNYSLTYNVKIFNSFTRTRDNRNTIKDKPQGLSIQNNQQKDTRKSAMYNARNSLKCFLAENMKDLRKKSTKSLNNYNYSLFTETKRDAEEKEILEEKKETKKKEENFADSLKQIITLKSCKNNNTLQIDDLGYKSKTIDAKNEKKKNKSEIGQSKIIQRLSTNLAGQKMDKKKTNKILMEIRKETQKRNRYLKLFNESNEKIKNLYSQLVDKTIDITNQIDNLGNLDTQICNNLDINKIVLNNINNDNDGSIRNISPPSYKKDNDSMSTKKFSKSSKKLASSYTVGNKSLKKFKNKSKQSVSKFDNKTRSKVDQVFINLNQPVLIFNNNSRSIDNEKKENKINKEKEKETIIFNNSLTNKNEYSQGNNNHTFRKSINNPNQTELSSFLSNISRNSNMKDKISEEVT